MLLNYQTSQRWEILKHEAQRMMLVSSELPNTTNWSHLSSRALYLISTLPEEEKESKKRCSPNSGPHLKKYLKNN